VISHLTILSAVCRSYRFLFETPFLLKASQFQAPIFALAFAVAVGALGIAPAAAQYANPVSPPEELATGYNSITQEQAKKWLGVLAGPEFEGRGTGQPGYTKAAHWVAGKLAEFGLEPIGDNGTYFQMLPMKRRVPVIDECFLSGDDFKITGKEIGLERFTSEQETTGEVVFLNLSGADPRLPNELQLRDKIVLYVTDQAAAQAAPRKIARKRPAAALRVISGAPRSISQLIRDGRRNRSTSVSGTITKAAALEIAKSLGGNEKWLAPLGKDGVESHATGKQSTLRMRFRVEMAAVPNVVAWIEGTDRELNHEYVVIGSHLDHLGIRGGQVYPGADDNGSGSTAVLSIAKAFAENKVRPKRSVMFIWFAAEEIGLVGSAHYCENPTKPLKNMTCMFNIDMVGRNEESDQETPAENEGSIHIVGSQKGQTDIHSIVLEANKHVGFRFELDQEDVWNRSDQINFYEKGVPVAFLFGGFHPDYHQPSDRIEQINFKKIVSAARLYYMAIHLASEHGRFELKQPKKNQQ